MKVTRGAPNRSAIAAAPWARAASPPLAPEIAPDPRRTAAGGKPLMVLVVEDNEINALLIQATLTRLGHTPAVVGNGLAAVNAVATANAMGTPYDVVLMDLHLPGTDGFEATRRIRALENGGEVPIIALTANAFGEDREACRRAGMGGFVIKPVDRITLEAAMREACAARENASTSESLMRLG